MTELKENKNAYHIIYNGAEVGIMEYTDFWEGMPYLKLIKLESGFRRRGIGREAMLLFEANMKRRGNKAVLLSTQSDEEAQHFYRKIGYSECGCLILGGTPFDQPMEMFFIKTL